MRKIIEDKEEGLIALLGEYVTIFCVTYFYYGKLIGVNDTCIKLEDAHIIYETGAFTEKKWKDAQKLPCDSWYIATPTIESFGIMDKTVA